MSTQLLRKLFTVEQYHRMYEAGVLTERDRVELIRGEIIQMSPIGKAHATCVDRLNRIFAFKLGDRVLVRVQNPIELAPESEPQPDITLATLKDDFYISGLPTPEDIFLLVEVADTTLNFDRTVKVPLYAEQGVTEVWIVNLNDRHIEVYRNPSPSGYQQVQTITKGQTISPQAFSDITFSLEQIFG